MDQAVGILSQYGLPGLAILALVYVVLALDRRMTKKDSDAQKVQQAQVAQHKTELAEERKRCEERDAVREEALQELTKQVIATQAALVEALNKTKKGGPR